MLEDFYHTIEIEALAVGGWRFFLVSESLHAIIPDSLPHVPEIFRTYLQLLTYNWHRPKYSTVLIFLSEMGLKILIKTIYVRYKNKA